MLNGDGSGFDQSFLPEKIQEPGQTLSNRSGMPVYWLTFDGDLERCFGSAPGVVYLCAEVDFLRPGRYEIVCGSEGGVKVWADSKQIVNASDSRGVDIANPGPFKGEVLTAGVSRMLVKLVRGKTPLSSFTFVVYAEDGSIVFPIVRDVLTTSARP
jgi:hypothetical protein